MTLKDLRTAILKPGFVKIAFSFGAVVQNKTNLLFALSHTYQEDQETGLSLTADGFLTWDNKDLV